jgi:hypothetical protein
MLGIHGAVFLNSAAKFTLPAPQIYLFDQQVVNQLRFTVIPIYVVSILLIYLYSTAVRSIHLPRE